METNHFLFSQRNGFSDLTFAIVLYIIFTIMKMAIVEEKLVNGYALKFGAYRNFILNLKTYLPLPPHLLNEKYRKQFVIFYL